MLFNEQRKVCSKGTKEREGEGEGEGERESQKKIKARKKEKTYSGREIERERERETDRERERNSSYNDLQLDKNSFRIKTYIISLNTWYKLYGLAQEFSLPPYLPVKVLRV